MNQYPEIATTAVTEKPVAVSQMLKQPLELSGILDNYESFDITPVIGKEFPKANVVDWMKDPKADKLLRDLAITISQRGVVVFRAQNNLTNDLQKDLILRLGELSGRPSTSKLHVHPIFNSERKDGGDDNEISTISSEDRKSFYAGEVQRRKKQSHNNWHSDLAFEPVPADYSSLRLTELPITGGGTLWTLIYDRLSEPMQKFLETLTATCASPSLEKIAADGGFSVYSQQRGSPENVGTSLKTEHPVIRTNPVTGWKSVFSVGQHTQRINGLADEESDMLLKWFMRILTQNHDLQVRHRWLYPNDLAIWDNRSTFHCATWDYDHLGRRFGNRAVGVGERPYVDPGSTSRQAALNAAFEH
ncbi:taurine catabolism dioxygenase [Zopfia rhizophila CBS 207.26]|uniref:Taurine catabolism dioxygenase n=1 Tax=Zopfia rhizophila CBS 207.26 TaxID=1314779 RepID=A0A6A6D641_9PEZI|nr:taurine catabolism dioxygenase [Zopfia rhizophila CBS 207.26]